MKKVTQRLSFFVSIVFLLIGIGLLLPTTPRASTSYVFEKLEMDELLKNTESPRIILIGGSNISLTINSQIFVDSLELNPINTGITANIGFVYMFDNTLKYIRPGDIVVASLEYDHFYGQAAYGGSDLARIILDVAPKEFFGLRRQQIYNILLEMPYYSLSKFKPNEYFFRRDSLEIYDREAFNRYGDNSKHWNRQPKNFEPRGPLPSKLNRFSFELLREFKLAIERKGANLYITFPALQAKSFENQKAGIKAVENELRKYDFVFLGSPERYIMPDSLMFDSPYHLIKTGVDLRTNLLVEDLKMALK